ncbi:MAG: enoyl-CoA hydratase/isomerase family protein [Acidimicrobiales bacterium]|nr:enoyl-CoA hydratase/isomerase family protein [Acidimicrobiales bacterium]
MDTAGGGDVDYRTIVYEVTDHIATITLNRPHRVNAFDSVMLEEMEHVWGVVDADPDVRVAIVAGAGDRGFCTGADLKEYAEAGPGAGKPIAKEWTDGGMRLTSAQCGVRKPVIAAIHGLCAGGGLHFPADSDIVICAHDAVFVDPHTRNGQVSAIETIGLAARMPFGEVLRMVLTGGGYRIDAQRAYQLGLVSEVVPRERLLEAALDIARQVASCSTATNIASKEALWGALDRGLLDAYSHGWRLLVAHHAHPDSMEGAIAFAEKREPRWAEV